jgi:hypothetical protein
MNKREFERRAHQERVLMDLGFTRDECDALRRISMTLQRWYEMECGTDNGCIERDEDTCKAYWLNSTTMRRHPIADRETGARKRLVKIIEARNVRAALVSPKTGNLDADKTRICVDAYIQTDPRGAALYIIRPGDVPEGAGVSSCYSRGICVY